MAAAGTRVRTATAGPGMAPDGALAVLELLRDWGVDRVFICPGSTEAAFLDASLHVPEVALTLTTQESIAVAMADGYARVTNRPAVTYLHTNVGLANGLAHLSCAHLERSPVVVLNGLKSTSLHGRSGFTTTSDVRDLARQHTKDDWQSLRADAIGEDLTRALKVAVAEPMGPTYLALPQDLLEAGAPVAVPAAKDRLVPARTRPDPESVRAAAARLAAAERPVIVAGAEVERSGAVEVLARLAERLGAPVLSEDRRTITCAGFPTDHPNYVGVLDPSLEAVAKADLLFLAGARTPIQFEASAGSSIPGDTALLHLSCDADDIARVHPTTVPLTGNARLGLEDLRAALEALPDPDGRQALAFLEQAHAAHRARVDGWAREARAGEGSVPIRVESLMHRLAGALEPGTVIVDDAVTSRAAVLRHLVSRGHDRYVATAGGSLGWAMGAALGAKLALPERPVVAVVGDGVFQFGLQALWTAVHEQIAVTYVVVNNESYAAVKAALRRFGGTADARGVYPASDLAGPGVADIARGFGALGRRVERLDELEASIAAAGEHPGPAVIEVLTDPDDSGP